MSSSVWNPQETIRDVSDALGISPVAEDASRNLALDVEYRVHEVIQEAAKFMRHSKRTTLSTQDISLALRTLNVEPMYGYHASRKLDFREAVLGTGQSLWYADDEEVDFEKIINAPLPKIPREVSFTAHWLAIEGIQPTIPQNPSGAEVSNEQEPKGATTGTSIAALGNQENVDVKPLIKHVLSKELLLYFERVTAALADDTNEGLRGAALGSLRQDPGLHQLLPYFVDYITEKVTHNLKSISVLETMLNLAHALLGNQTIFIDPYIHSLIPPLLTCLVAKKIGPPNSPEHYRIRELAADLIEIICRNFAQVYHTLKPRLTRTLLKAFLDNTKPLPTHYGSITGLKGMGPEVVRVLVLPNIKLYETLLTKEGTEEYQREKNVDALVDALRTLENDTIVRDVVKDKPVDEVHDMLNERIGSLLGDRIWQMENENLIKVILQGASL